MRYNIEVCVIELGNKYEYCIWNDDELLWNEALKY